MNGYKPALNQVENQFKNEAHMFTKEYDINIIENKPIDEEKINQLATMTSVEYDRNRISEAKILNIRPGTLDTLVKLARIKLKKENKTPFIEINPWPQPINPSELLTEISKTIRRFIICPNETIIAATLWIAMTWFIDSIEVAPLAIITAPEKRCGKSQLLFLLGRLVYRPLVASNITTAALFRSIDAWKNQHY